MLQVAGWTSVLLSVLPPSRILGPESRAFPEALKYDINTRNFNQNKARILNDVQVYHVYMKSSSKRIILGYFPQVELKIYCIITVEKFANTFIKRDHFW